jgi:hypothetical protein
MCVGCPSGQTLCGGNCVDTQTDRINCGGCNSVCPQACSNGRCVCVVCPQGAMCSNGVCVCPTGYSMCGSGDRAVCANLMTDSQHCGTCGNLCPPTASCVSGSCKLS